MKIGLFNSNNEADVQINIVPLIDVIFCILTFFILAALQLTRQQAININLPKASTAALQTRQTLMVSVDSIGQVYVDRDPVSPDQLYLLLEGYRRVNPQGLMVLYADRDAVYQDVIKLLDLMRSVGGDRVALATSPQDGKPVLQQPGQGANPFAPAPNAPGFNMGLPQIPGNPGTSDGTGVPNTAPAPGIAPAPDLQPPPPLPGEPAAPAQ